MRLKSEKQERFCQLYAKSGNATQSFIDAGYSVQSKNAAAVRAHALLNKNGNIQNRLRELHEEVDSKAIADIREMQETLTQIIREELDEETLMTVGAGEGYSEIVSRRKKAALKDRLKALELLGKMQGAFVDNVNINGNVPVTFVEDLKPDE
jgi:phage terminase small subunit